MIPRLLALLVLTTGLALSPADARPVDSLATCRAACPVHVADACNGLRPGKYRGCRARMWRQCRRWGARTVCPAPLAPTPTTLPPATLPPATLPPPPPTTTPTTLPPVVTTTTLPAVRDLRGRYQFEGHVTSDACALFGIGAYTPVPFTVSAQTGTNLAGTVGANGVPAIGTYTPATGGWNMGGRECDGMGCCATTVMGVGADTFPAGTVWQFEGECSDGTYCFVESDGVAYPY